MKQAILSKPLIEPLNKALNKAGIVPDNCQRIIIDISYDNIVHIYYSVIGDERLLDIDWGTALEVIDEPKAEKYIWHCVMDSKSCVWCKTQDNRLFTKEEIKSFAPPLHDKEEHSIGCRCFLTMVSGDKLLKEPVVDITTMADGNNRKYKKCNNKNGE